MFGSAGYWYAGQWKNAGPGPKHTDQKLVPPARTVGAATTEFYDGNLTAGRHNYYGTLYIGDTPIGGMQAWSVRETNGTQFIPNAGNDWLEPRFGMRMWQGQGSRFMIRGRDLQQIMRRYYAFGNKGLLTDVDFRFTPFTWLFHFNMESYLHRKIEDLAWHIATVWITEYTWKYTSPFDLLYEDFSFIAKGLRRVDTTPSVVKAYPDAGLRDFGNPIELWGNPNPANNSAKGLSNYDDPGVNAFDDELLAGLVGTDITFVPDPNDLP
jgi:hypothetical protein